MEEARPPRSEPHPPPRDRLARRLGPGAALVVGLGAMLGAGVFGAWGPAAAAAGDALPVALAAAAAVAALNALASARLARRHPESGGTYVYASRRLGPGWGVLAGWCFVCGKTASCAAMALVFGAYVVPEHPRAGALAALAACAAVNHLGIRATARATGVILAVVGVALLAAVAGGVRAWGAPAGPTPDPVAGASPGDVLQAAGFLFFAFAGYARLATLGEEVRDPARTIPRAIGWAFAIVLAVYAVLAAVLVSGPGPARVAATAEPLVDLVRAGDLDALAPLVRLGAGVAALGVLVALLAGVGRTAFAMADDGHLPRVLAHVDPRVRAPRRASGAAALAAALALLVADLRVAIGVSSVLVLAYYALANASALRLPPGRGHLLRAAAALGVAGCLVVALSLPPEALGAGVLVGAGGGAVLLALGRRGGRPRTA